MSKEEMREMRVGQKRIFILADKGKVKSVRVQATALKNEEGLEFEINADYAASAVCITRNK